MTLGAQHTGCAAAGLSLSSCVLGAPITPQSDPTTDPYFWMNNWSWFAWGFPSLDRESPVVWTQLSSGQGRRDRCHGTREELHLSLGDAGGREQPLVLGSHRTPDIHVLSRK